MSLSWISYITGSCNNANYLIPSLILLLLAGILLWRKLSFIDFTDNFNVNQLWFGSTDKIYSFIDEKNRGLWRYKDLLKITQELAIKGCVCVCVCVLIPKEKSFPWKILKHQSRASQAVVLLEFLSTFPRTGPGLQNTTRFSETLEAFLFHPGVKLAPHSLMATAPAWVRAF